MPFSSSACVTPYRWYRCNFGRTPYSGCCSVDPCDTNPPVCPTDFEQPGTAPGTSTVSSSTSSPSASSSSIPSTTSTSLMSWTTTDAATDLASLPPPNADNSGGGGPAVPTGVLAGSVLGCLIAAVLAAVLGALCWTWRKRRNHSPGGSGSELWARHRVDKAPDGTVSGTTDFGGGFRFGAGGGTGGHSRSKRRTDARCRCSTCSQPVSPLTTGTAWARYSQTSELDWQPARGLAMAAAAELEDPSATTTSAPSTPGHPNVTQGPKTAAPGSVTADTPSPGPGARDSSGTDWPRATLNSTDGEGESKTYATSWTRYHDIQI